jgi:hypothetical protein
MWIFNTIKFRILENFILDLWYIKVKQEWSHIKYDLSWKTLIIPKHNEISRWTLNNIFKILAVHINLDKNTIERQFLDFIK